jgi:hypothetical protein
MIELEILRSCILEALRREPQTQYVQLDIQTASVARERGLPIRDGHEPHLAPEVMRRFRETVWSLVIEGIVAIGKNEYNTEWPWLSLTEYGEEVVAAGRITPYDPAEYLRTLTPVWPLDEVEERYLVQALGAFRHNLPDAAAVMLGAASEHLITLLGERVEAADPHEASRAHSLLDGPALRLLVWLHEYLQQRKSRMDRGDRESLGTTFLGIATLIRAARNDAGHPALGTVSREQVFINLQLFPPYRSWLLRLRDRLPL